MAALSGTAGSVVYTTGGNATVGNISEWSLDLSHSPVEVTAFGDDWQKYVPSIRGATGSFSGNFDHADTPQTDLLDDVLDGTVFGLRLYMDSAKYFLIATAYVTGISPSTSQSGKADVSVDFLVSDAVTWV